MKIGLIFLGLLSFVPSLRAQTAEPKNLADYIASINWNEGKYGPLLAMEPQSVNRGKTGDGLAAFRRMRISLPGLTGFVPATMVVIDDSFHTPPNLYDGLPRHVKVLYLLTTLNAEQWDAVTGPGLGIDQLTKDQRAVFTSLMPKPFKISSFTVDSKGDPITSEPPAELSEADVQATRLHVDRCLQFMTPIIGQPNSLTQRDTAHDFGPPGTRVVERESSDDYHKQDSFGVQIRQTVPNKAKKSDLDYRSNRFEGTISLLPSEKLSDLLGRIGKATGTEIWADLRVGNRSFTAIGETAPISSVLKMIALSVTGTYRRVGPAFILTSDLEGMGTRKLKIAEYDGALNDKVFAQEQKWRSEIFKSGHLHQVKFRGDDPLNPSDALVAKIDKGTPSQQVKITGSDLNPALRQFFDRQNKMYSTQQVTADGAIVESEFEFSFILPSGEHTRADNESLGQSSMFAMQSDTQFVNRYPSVERLEVSKVTFRFPLGMNAQTAEEAEAVISLAAKYQLKEVWIHTLSKEALAAALKSGAANSIRVGLLFQPFALESSNDLDSADRNILGETAPQAEEHRKASSDFEKVKSHGRPFETRLGGLSPISSNYQDRAQRIIELANTKGLEGLHVVDPTPSGYAGPRVTYMSFPPSLFLELGNLGYADDLRLQFIRLRQVDPIDLCPPNVYTNSDLRQPFFLDDGLRGTTSVYDGTDSPNPAIAPMVSDYSVWLAKINRRALLQFLKPIATAHPELPISIDSIPNATNAVNWLSGGLVPWHLGDPLPEVGEGGARDYMANQAKNIQRLSLSAIGPDIAKFGLHNLTTPGPHQQKVAGILLDLTSLTFKDASSWMGEAFLLPSK